MSVWVSMHYFRCSELEEVKPPSKQPRTPSPEPASPRSTGRFGTAGAATRGPARPLLRAAQPFFSIVGSLPPASHGAGDEHTQHLTKLRAFPALE